MALLIEGGRYIKSPGISWGFFVTFESLTRYIYTDFKQTAHGGATLWKKKPQHYKTCQVVSSLKQAQRPAKYGQREHIKGVLKNTLVSTQKI